MGWCFMNTFSERFHGLSSSTFRLKYSGFLKYCLSKYSTNSSTLLWWWRTCLLHVNRVRIVPSVLLVHLLLIAKGRVAMLLHVDYAIQLVVSFTLLIIGQRLVRLLYLLELVLHRSIHQTYRINRTVRVHVGMVLLSHLEISILDLLWFSIGGNVQKFVVACSNSGFLGCRETIADPEKHQQISKAYIIQNMKVVFVTSWTAEINLWAKWYFAVEKQPTLQKRYWPQFENPSINILIRNMGQCYHRSVSP
jgi:hypothetical protein